MRTRTSAHAYRYTRTREGFVALNLKTAWTALTTDHTLRLRLLVVIALIALTSFFSQAVFANGVPPRILWIVLSALMLCGGVVLALKWKAVRDWIDVDDAPLSEIQAKALFVPGVRRVLETLLLAAWASFVLRSLPGVHIVFPRLLWSIVSLLTLCGGGAILAAEWQELEARR